jgi:hypothetical protein
MSSVGIAEETITDVYDQCCDGDDGHMGNL